MGRTVPRLVDVFAKGEYPLSPQDVLEPTLSFQAL